MGCRSAPFSFAPVGAKASPARDGPPGATGMAQPRCYTRASCAPTNTLHPFLPITSARTNISPQPAPPKSSKTPPSESSSLYAASAPTRAHNPGPAAHSGGPTCSPPNPPIPTSPTRRAARCAHPPPALQPIARPPPPLQPVASAASPHSATRCTQHPNNPGFWLKNPCTATGCCI